MSELKVYFIPIKKNMIGITTVKQSFYLKTEADKVIADLEQKLAAAQQVLRLNEPKALYSNLETMGRLKHEIDVVARRERHQKYKRCLAMAAKYLWKRNYWRDSTPAYERQHQWENMAYKHYKRWLELAEKFKEVNNVAVLLCE